jgi:glutaminyl-peptide cyclotransferase
LNDKNIYPNFGKAYNEFVSFAIDNTPRMSKKLFCMAMVISALSCSDNNSSTDDPGQVSTPPAAPAIPAPQNISYTIIGVYPHDTSSFIQGLQWHRGKLYEGSGDFENSGIQISEIKTGKVLSKNRMGSDTIFGEGITLLNGKLYQLTWKNKLVYVYDENNLAKPERSVNWPHEGWGITNDGRSLYISDGRPTGNIFVVNPDSFTVQRIITVSTNNGPVDKLNELEYINGFLYANVWMTDNIVKIDPATGHVKGVMNLSGLLQQYAAKEIQDPHFQPDEDVLNGIAWDSTAKKMYVTGKRWPKLFEIRLNE